ncbi:CHAT domain-containing protein [Micromonospora tulbaghiae]
MDADDLEKLTAQAYEEADLSGVDNLRHAAASFTPDPDSPRQLAVLGGAWLVAYKLSQRPEDLLAAFLTLQEAHELQPSPARAANLAAALLEATDLDDFTTPAERAQLHRRATGLLKAVLAATPEDDERWVTQATSMASALLDAVNYRIPGADLDGAIELGERLVAVAEGHDSRSGEPYNLLGCILLAAADRGDARGDLDRAVALLRASIERTPQGHVDLPARQSNLASLLADRFERSGAPEDLAESIALHRSALAAMAPADVRRPLAVNNLVNALVGRFRLLGEPSDLSEAADLLPQLLSGFGPRHPMYAVARSNAGLLVQELGARGDQFGATDRTGVLNMAAQLHADAVNATHDDDPAWAGRAGSLAVTLTTLYQYTGDQQVLTQALRLATAAAEAGATGAPHELAVFRSNLGNLHHEVFLRTGRITDLDRAAHLHLLALADLPDRNPIVPGLLNNAAIALSDRYERLGDAGDLRAALDAVQRSLALSAHANPDRPARLNNLASMLIRLFELTGDSSALDLAAQQAQLGADLAVGHGDAETEASCLATLSDALATRRRELHDDQAAEELAALWRDKPGRLQRGRPGLQAARTLREAVLAGDGENRLRLLRQAAEVGLEERPAVALAAARQLAADGVVLQVNGHAEGVRVVDDAATLGFAALSRLVGDGDQWRHALSWYREAQGMGALTAQSRLLAGDPDRAITAFDDGHAALLRTSLRPASGRPVEAEPHWTASVWCTQVGGAAVLTAPDGQHIPVPLPGFTLQRAQTWARRLANAARLSQTSVESVLRRQVLPELTLLVAVPVSRVVPPGESLTWCAGGVAAMLPIAAARGHDGEQFLLRHVLRQAPTPSIARATAAAAKQMPGPAAAPGWTIAAPQPSRYPPLPAAAIEMSAFGQPPRQLVGTAATADAARVALTEAHLLHVACHARTTAADPLTNHLLLAGDEPLFADEIARMSLPARIVILAACDTAAVGSAHADEALGLAGAFLAAGVPAVVASLWSVGDESTGRLMHRLGRYLRDGLEPTAALHLARIDQRSGDEPTSSWAAITLLGA